MTTLKEVELRYCEGSSDKVYIAKIVKMGSVYNVPCEYGRRGSTLKPADKGTYATLGQATAAFEKVVIEKTRKGYHVYSSSDAPKTVKTEAPKPVEEVFDDKVLVCEDNAREKALARLKASSVW